MTALTVPAPMTRPAAADPTPSARDIARSKSAERARAADVGRTKAQLAEANGELERLAIASATAVERYNGEIVKLQRARDEHKVAEQRLAQANVKLTAAQQDLAKFAVNAYQINTGANPWMAALGGHGGPQGFMDRAGMVDVMARQRTGMVQKVEAARNVADVFKRQAQEALDEQAAATKRSAEAKRQAEAAVADQQAAVRRLAASKRRLEARLGSAQAHTEELQRRREAAMNRMATQSFSGSGRTAINLARGSARGSLVVRAALKFIGTPYSWGGGTASGPSYGVAQGAGILGFDCSGLALYAWNKAGVRLDHWTGTQWTSGPHVPVSQLRAGDLVFFASDTGDPDTIHHVGIYLGQGRMIEAPYTGASVRISSIYRNGLIGATRPAG
ncbi:C40 family peptidase [Actinomadura barringtoniae]|uniref:C40 family peptidase n=2 Tax=Actinomadura barringtoniae TaxID=1427535 RepID=A0A939PLX0_9ACTN|nr:C40 family peptidase [Actinomadura barringtoniae]